MIYFIKNIVSGNIKIGYSVTPRARLRDLQTGSDARLILIKTIEGVKETERKLHEMFAHLRRDGEWFEPGEEILEFVRHRNRKSLEEKFFHSYEKDRKVKWQGYVLSEPKEGYFLVQLFEWFMGQPSCQRLVPIEDMIDWDFYDSAEEMNEAYERKS